MQFDNDPFAEFSPSLCSSSLLSLLSSSTSNPMAEEDVLQLFAESDEVNGSPATSGERLESTTSEEQSEKDNGEDLHPIACVRCRKMHKFCSRSKSGCDRCKSKGIECEYRDSKRVRSSCDNHEDKKRKKVSSSRSSEVDSEENESTTDSDLVAPENTALTMGFPKHFSKPLAINCYYWMICDINIIVEKKEMERYILHNYGTETMAKKEMEAFFYSAKALVEQFVGQCDSAEESSQKSKKKIALLIDEEPSHIVFCTYYNLALYEIGTGRGKLSSYYLHCSKFNYMNKTESELSNMNEYEKMLQKSIGFLENLAIDEIDVTKMTRSFPKLFEYATGKSLPESISLSLQQEVNQENCFQFIKIGEEITSIVIESTKDRASSKKTDSQMTTYTKALQFMKSILFNGMRAGVLIKATCRKDIIEESCLNITYLTQSEFFGVASVFMTPFFALAARVHLQIVKSIENGTRKNFEYGIGPNDTSVQIDYYDILAKDYRALNVLASRFKRIAVHNAKLLSTISEILSNTNHLNRNVTIVQDFFDKSVWK